MNVDLVWSTPNGEDLIAYMARVSNPENEHNSEYIKLLRYLMKNKHWSPFEMAHMCVRIETSRAIAAQILRHRSFSFQEFSQRYAEVTAFEPIELRKQHIKNRQSSTEVFDPAIEAYDSTIKASDLVDSALEQVKWTYQELVRAGVAKESARMILPLTTQTTLYMVGNVRSFLHYIELRTDHHAQKEHQLLAQEIEQLFAQNYPRIYAAWIEQRNNEELTRLLLEKI